jgi:DNA polymerase-2
MQLKSAGKEMRPGQRVLFLYTMGKPGVFAWDRPQNPNPRAVDVERYQRLLLRAAGIVLESWGLDEDQLTKKILSDASQLTLPVSPKQHPLKHNRNIPGVINTAVKPTLKGKSQ